MIQSKEVSEVKQIAYSFGEISARAKNLKPKLASCIINHPAAKILATIPTIRHYSPLLFLTFYPDGRETSVAGVVTHKQTASLEETLGI